MSDNFRGYVAGIVAASTYGLNPLFALPLYSLGVNPDTLLAYRYGFAGLILGIIMWLTRRSLRLSLRQCGLMAVLGLTMAMSSLALFESYRYMDAGIASTILFVYPVFVAVINIVLFKEALSPVTLMAIILASAGIILLYNGDGETTLNLTGTLLVLLSAITYAVYMVMVNRSAVRSVSSEALTFYSVLFGLPLFLSRIIFLDGFTPVNGFFSWGCIICIAVFPTILSLMTMGIAIHKIGSTPTAILGALEPVTALIIGVCVFGEQLTFTSVIGISLILTAVTLIVLSKPLMAAIRHYMAHHRHA